jgi:predicted nucleotidyltransferase
MGELDRQLAEELKRRLPPEIRGHLRQLILFGSRARGDAAEDSDLDLVALVDEKTPELERALDDIAYNVMWDNDFHPVISLKVFSEARFRSALEQGYSFYRNVMREGVMV